MQWVEFSFLSVSDYILMEYIGTRKLACSKDDGGCARCKRENIACHYSEQKPMGRPRKRQFIESTDPATTLDTDPLGLGPAPSIVNNTHTFQATDPAEALFMNGNIQLDFSGDLDPSLYSKHGNQYSKWQFGGSIGGLGGGPPINFGDLGSGSDEASPSSNESAPQLSTGSSSDAANSPPQNAYVPCGCLASSRFPPHMW